ncbi:unnamed protein product [Paramecium pentaurelia]|uniref:Transmembrane protein n=1 Tax=Paramecium pentaurelia TaxID=43138 RepID=A0A8S1W1F0_9CILI|nr:unnamed protein product [Paramecium pentaurelia]
MNKFIQNLRKNDFFSVTYFPAISDGFNFNHSSVLGGMISIFIAILSLMYGWTYQLLPKVTSDLNQFSEKDNFGQLKNFINIKPPYQQGWSPIDPFKRDEIILQPLIQMILNSNVNDVLNINLHMNYTKQYYIIFTLCKEDYLLDQQKCASEETKNLYLKQHGNSLYIEIQFTTIKPSKFEPQIFERTYQIHIHSQAEIQSISILNNWIRRTQFYISNSLNYPQYSLKDYCDKQFLPNTYEAFFVLFQQQYYTVQIVYPPISEVFAAIGSIISILFSVKFIITILNLQQLKQDVLDDIMTQYYPEIKQFQIIKNWFGKIIQVKFKGLQVDISSYFQFQKQIHFQMAYSNLYSYQQKQELKQKEFLIVVLKFLFNYQSLEILIQLHKVK